MRWSHHTISLLSGYEHQFIAKRATDIQSSSMCVSTKMCVCLSNYTLTHIYTQTAHNSTISLKNYDYMLLLKAPKHVFSISFLLWERRLTTLFSAKNVVIWHYRFLCLRSVRGFVISVNMFPNKIRVQWHFNKSAIRVCRVRCQIFVPGVKLFIKSNKKSYN